MAIVPNLPVVDAARILRWALEESVKLQSHYAKILNEYDGGKRIIFKNAREWLQRISALEGPDADPS